jgi:glycerophosphoryl diester phosphodiesterase
VTETTPRVLAHRGANRRARENTVEAFALAAELGAHGVELDVHRAADGLVVTHDPWIDDLGVPAEFTVAQIQAVDPMVPTLTAALDACAGMLVNVEIKNFPGDADFDPDERVVDEVVELLHARGRRDDVLVSSFSLDSLTRVRALDATLPTGFLTLLGFDPIDAAAVARGHGHSAVHPDVRSLLGPVAAATAARCHELGLQMNVWTVNDPAELRRLADAGVDAVITDVPDVAREILSGR